MSHLVVVLTALNLEYAAVREHLVDVDLRRHDAGTRFEIGRVPSSRCQIVLGLTGVGNQPAAVLAERAIQSFEPAAVLFTGIAGALWDGTPLGDVVVADRVYAYHGGTSEDDGFKARPRMWETSHALSQVAHHLARQGRWTDRLGDRDSRPTVRFGAIAAGEIVQNSRVSKEAHWIREHFNDATAIEMEAAGIAQAGHLNSAPVAIIRGISDSADGRKTAANDENWQPRAAANAAAFAVELAVELVDESKEGYMKGSMPSEIPIDGGVTNMVAGGVVGQMGGVITGGTVHLVTGPHQTSESFDVVAELHTLRTLIDERHTAGVTDEETHRDAVKEVETAEQALNAVPRASKRAVNALKRLTGLLADVSDVAARARSLAGAVKELA
ncbi:5'-methylthioadenosine/S-adenosylhomocysteine nucleosidase family protein [Myceligenerans indicum]|uniref:5'-methylthioadenosine/S-adenosylhomocysteine nucleosidase n=1 Tax=Myceligenerans indicum TaxID=2593663 RepID=A0ABS1LHV6_9MICO|nr:5'-methylthioadenosine/S-adenosylhomocysteine nucleosidase [Myceligenerans indicum]MBL0885718.1 5'-methylthioadenosine/S-adenosylhomocysteine nucleosidase [Myceligenerans indicum]